MTCSRYSSRLPSLTILWRREQRSLHRMRLPNRDGDEALASAEIVTALFPETIDGYAQQVRVALAADRPKHGLEAGRAALQLMPGSSELLLATAGFAHACGE